MEGGFLHEVSGKCNIELKYLAEAADLIFGHINPTLRWYESDEVSYLLMLVPALEVRDKAQASVTKMLELIKERRRQNG